MFEPENPGRPGPRNAPAFRAAALAALAASSVAGVSAAAPKDVAEAAPPSAWRAVDPVDMLVLELSTGRVVIELREDFAPAHVERIRSLARSGFYDGLVFHRVIDGFMAQGGDPRGDGTGGSSLPDLPAEFEKLSVEAAFEPIGRDTVAPRVGFVDGMPAGGLPEASRAVRADGALPVWPLHCGGVASMARADDPNSANSQFFIIFEDSRISLDRRYSAWGLVVDGKEAADALPRGEPPKTPGEIRSARIGSDLSEPPEIEVMRTDSEAFERYLAEVGVYSRAPSDGVAGFVRNICSVRVPRRVDGELEL